MAQSETQRQIEENRRLVQLENDRLAREKAATDAAKQAAEAAKEWK